MSEEKPHNSDSSTQLEVEDYLLKKYSEDNNCDLKEDQFPLDEKRHMRLDGYDKTNKIACEVYARLGILNPVI